MPRKIRNLHAENIMDGPLYLNAECHSVDALLNHRVSKRVPRWRRTCVHSRSRRRRPETTHLTRPSVKGAILVGVALPIRDFLPFFLNVHPLEIK